MKLWILETDKGTKRLYANSAQEADARASKKVCKFIQSVSGAFKTFPRTCKHPTIERNDGMKKNTPIVETAEQTVEALKGEHFLIVAGHAVAKVRTNNKRVINLIASAPELLAALKRADKWIKCFASDHPDIYETSVQNTAAIAKAEGRLSAQ